MKKIYTSGLLLLILVACNSSKQNSSDSEAYIYSVHGKLGVENLGVSLTHEHVMSRFGLEPAYIAEYDIDSLLLQVVPYLKDVKSLGVNTLFDCTAAYFGRNVGLLKQISDATGVEIITNTGYYAAANDRYVPESAFTSSREEIAQIWIDEFEKGIDGTEIKPGFIKLAFDEGVSEIDTKLFTAGILTHLHTGLTLVVHTENNLQAVEKQLELLEEYKVSPSAWIWVHAIKVDDVDLLVETAMKGGWISLDKFKAAETDEYVSRIKLFREKGLINKVLLSHDGNSYNSEGKLRGYQAIMTHLIPALKENDFSEEDINQLLVTNPQNAFKIEVRKHK